MKIIDTQCVNGVYEPIKVITTQPVPFKTVKEKKKERRKQKVYEVTCKVDDVFQVIHQAYKDYKKWELLLNKFR